MYSICFDVRKELKSKSLNIKRVGTCLLSKLIDTQVARRGRQYHRNPATKKKKKGVY